jgi:hypothetical protein
MEERGKDTKYDTDVGNGWVHIRWKKDGRIPNVTQTWEMAGFT